MPIKEFITTYNEHNSYALMGVGLLCTSAFLAIRYFFYYRKGTRVTGTVTKHEPPKASLIPISGDFSKPIVKFSYEGKEYEKPISGLDLSVFYRPVFKYTIFRTGCEYLGEGAKIDLWITPDKKPYLYSTQAKGEISACIFAGAYCLLVYWGYVMQSDVWELAVFSFAFFFIFFLVVTLLWPNRYYTKKRASELFERNKEFVKLHKYHKLDK